MDANTSAKASATRRFATGRLVVAYTLMLGGTIAVLLTVRTYGERLSPAALDNATTTAPGLAARNDSLFHVLLALLAIVLLGRLLGRLFLYFSQPRVVGEIVAGIVLGPSLLGRISPEAMTLILPPAVAPYLGTIAQIGVILYMFLVGLELNAGLLRCRAQAAIAISHASIVVPFLLGTVLALWLYRPLAPPGVPFTSFALFIGVAMSITAFPVLARILADRHMETTELGVLALSCAAADDVTAWCLLAFVVGVAQADVGSALQTTAFALSYLAIMFLVVRPLALRYLARQSQPAPSRHTVVWVLVALLLSALATEAIGIHAIFGAFLLGAIIPHDSPITLDFKSKLEALVTILLLPAFFAYTGMQTEIGLVATPHEWLFCTVIILVATLGKFGGTLVAARLMRLDWRTSAALGILLNTRGLMELVVLNIGLELGVISPKLFAMMVIMALVTTIATTPILRALTHADDRPHASG